MKKLKSKAGFTLVEVLISLVIITMSVALFSGIVHSTHAVVAKQADYRVDMSKQYETLDRKFLGSMSTTPTGVNRMSFTFENISKSSATTVVDTDRLETGSSSNTVSNVNNTLSTKIVAEQKIDIGKFETLFNADIYSSNSSTSTFPSIYAYRYNPKVLITN